MSHILIVNSSSKRGLNKLNSIKNCFKNSLVIKRNILSPAYACNEVWNSQRKECETLKNISTERYFFELNQKYQQKQRVSPIDIDIFINLTYKSENQEELEHMIRRFRSTKFTVHTLESTHHAVCRFYLKNNKLDRLLHILNNRAEFGIFPDVFCYNMILDYCIEKGENDKAFDTVKLMMLQEFSGNEITKALSFHVLQKQFEDGFFGLLKKEEIKGEGEENEAETKEPENDDEIEYVRVPFVTNPYSDDHFDLTDKPKLWGKSLYFFGLEYSLTESGKNNILLCNNAKIMGLIAFEKFEKLENVIQNLGENIEIVPETIELVNLKLKQLEESQTDDDDDEKIKYLNKSKKCLEKIKNLKTTTNEVSFKTLTENLLKEISKYEKNDIEEQIKIFKEFEQKRINEMKIQIERVLHEQKYKEIQDKKNEIEEKKRLYYFFENFAKHEIDFVEAEKRIKEIQENTVVDEDYVPPEK